MKRIICDVCGSTIKQFNNLLTGNKPEDIENLYVLNISSLREDSTRGVTFSKESVRISNKSYVRKELCSACYARIMDFLNDSKKTMED